MAMFPDITVLRTSWTKYDIVKVIEITISGELESYKNGEQGIDEPILKSYLGIAKVTDKLPYYWNQIYEYPKQVGLFALVAAIFTHYENIERFIQYNRGEMHGVLKMEPGKHFTNLRSALVVSGATETIYRTKQEVPYDLSRLFEIGDVGKLTKDLLIERLVRVGYEIHDIKDNFEKICLHLGFNEVLGLTPDQFVVWTKGTGISNSLFELQKNNITYKKFGRIKALKVKQWLKEWDQVQDYEKTNRRKPEPFFYQFNIPAILLKRIYDVHSRLANVERKDEPFSQRKHSEKRSHEIREFVKGGFPWSTITQEQRASETYKDLQMPGWLPTSIIANILNSDNIRRQKKISEDELIKIEHIDENFADIILPEKIWTDRWTPIVAPIEIIDGQHRIKAFDSLKEIPGEFELPVIAFFDLDFTWQAYLFYTINIKPKRINTSLAYDLMPLLRIQNWLEHDINGPDIYKKVRAQELTELLWATEVSPWYNRINMLGDTGEAKGGPVSQNAFINSLIVSFVKKWEGKIGGLFGGEMHLGHQDVIQWDKETQVAFLILIWTSICEAIDKSEAKWVKALKKKEAEYQRSEAEEKLPIGFIHKYSFFTTDQGVRPVLFIFNDMCFEANDFLGLNRFTPDVDAEKYTTSEVIEIILDRFRENTTIKTFVDILSIEIIDKFEWRTPSAFDPSIKEEDELRQHQNQFRGSSGYREMRLQLLRVLSESPMVLQVGDKQLEITSIAKNVQQKLGF